MRFRADEQPISMVLDGLPRSACEPSRSGWLLNISILGKEVVLRYYHQALSYRRIRGLLLRLYSPQQGQIIALIWDFLKT